ncbi:MAG TPA: pyridoxamine 5'-phosphate oxidase family protein [Candidatus Dormibacteraeota bacterium]
MSEERTLRQRKADTVAALNRQRDLWLATADKGGKPHLIAVSAWWDGSHLIIATAAASRSARNLDTNGIARLALGSPDDVIVIDAAVADRVKVREATAEFAGGFTAAVGWDPREINADWVFFRLTPTRIQAYRGYDELEGRDVMQLGRWLD